MKLGGGVFLQEVASCGFLLGILKTSHLKISNVSVLNLQESPALRDRGRVEDGRMCFLLGVNPMLSVQPSRGRSKRDNSSPPSLWKTESSEGD